MFERLLITTRVAGFWHQKQMSVHQGEPVDEELLDLGRFGTPQRNWMVKSGYGYCTGFSPRSLIRRGHSLPGSGANGLFRARLIWKIQSSP